MTPASKMAANIESTKNPSAEAAAGSAYKLGEQLRTSFEDLQRTNPQRPVEDVQSLLSRISHRLDYDTSERKNIYYRLLAIENQGKRRGSRRFARYLVAISIGVLATLAWQSYGEATKRIVATKAPELAWSPEAKQMIASWVRQLGWTKPSAGVETAAAQSSVAETPQATPVAQTSPAVVAPSTPAAPSIDPEQVHQIASDLTALRQTVEQLAGRQDQIGRDVDRLQAAVAEILVKIPEPPPPRPVVAPARKPTPTTPPSSRAPIPPPHP